MNNHAFDASGRFVIKNYAAQRPFASFLPGVAGPLGVPLWVFYVNRGQTIASFGVESKDVPILEFQPANKAYQLTPYTGFRTFVKIQRDGTARFYEPFAACHVEPSAPIEQQMAIGMNELELQEIDTAAGLQVNVAYFTVPHENFAGLARQVTLQNISARPMTLEVLDGLPAVSPYGVNNLLLKEIGRTLEAWMEVFNVAQHMPYYRLRASVGDTAEVETFEAGHFALAFLEREQQVDQLPALVDPVVVFGHNTSLSAPDRFNQTPLADLLQASQITTGQTPSAFFGASATIAPGESLALNSVFGHVSHQASLPAIRNRLLRAGRFTDLREQANALTQHLTEPIATQTSAQLFDAYCRQTLLDNIIRGGWPVTWGKGDRAQVYHIYSRKHGDLERDYNAFALAAEYFSQGNGNYRDVNQNRRCDVLFNPHVGDFNIRTFVSLLQADGYNPLVVQGSRFTLSPEKRAAVLAQVDRPSLLTGLFAAPFTPGQIVRAIADSGLLLRGSIDEFLALVMQSAEQHVAAAPGEGFWVDHWTYNLDLIDSYLAVYPDRQDALLFGDPTLPFFDNPAFVQPRSQKYVLAHDQVRQFGAVREDHEKAALIASRAEQSNWLRTAHGCGAVYRTTLFAKLVSLALIKFATLDPLGMGVEMEAGKPGWYDAMNGLPGLFGSSLSETYELQRLMEFLLDILREKTGGALDLPIELRTLLRGVAAQLQTYHVSADAQRDFVYWDSVATAREVYRASIRLGLSGETQSISWPDLTDFLASCVSKIRDGIQRAVNLNGGIPPTYFIYEVTRYDIIHDADGVTQADAQGRPFIRARSFEPQVLPLFLEGPVHALKTLSTNEAAQLHRQVKASPLFDRELKMYKVNASLADQPPDIGRARVFTPGWLENESIWLHMEYKYLLEVLRAGLVAEFYDDFKTALIPFLDPQTYGRSPLENSSFLVSSAHPDRSLHGAGFVARLSGSTAEFLSMWQVMMMGRRPFHVKDGQLHLAFKPALPGWLFTEEGTVTFRFLGQCTVIYHNPRCIDTFSGAARIEKIDLQTGAGQHIELTGDLIGPPYAAMARAGQIKQIDVYFEAGG
jgi:hypothetical protein